MIDLKIGVVTTTRAEYGVLKALIKNINDDPETELNLIVTGTHLMKEYGNTIQYIEEDGFPIKKKIYVDINTENSTAISKTMGRYFEAFSGVFEELALDFLVVIGDRYELIPICYCAANARTPIAHISGGEVTEGAIDDSVRHSVTKLSYIHFPACETYRERIIQLGEDPQRVFNVGDPGVENVIKGTFLTEKELREKLKLTAQPYFAVIFHPVTLDEISPEIQVDELLSAISRFKDIQFVIMKSNADVGGGEINKKLEEFVIENKNCSLFSSLKIEEFLSLQKYSMGLLGNSSSGIIETPCFGIPTINIGDRQRGRLFADSIISCPIDADKISDAITLALSEDFRQKAKNAKNPYGFGDTSAQILEHIKQTIKSNNVDLKKKFFDITKGNAK